jgi:hypothetical protein
MAWMRARAARRGPGGWSLAVIGAAVLGGLGPRAAAAGPAEALADELVARMVAAERAAQRWSFVMERTERVGGALQPSQTMVVLYEKPFSVYARWTGEVDRGQELLIRRGWNNEQLRVNPPGIVPTLDLDPRGAVAMRGNRHSIHDVGFTFLVGRIASDHAIAKRHPDKVSVVDLGARTIGGRSARCYRAKLPKGEVAGLYALQAEICVDDRLGLPTEVIVWDRVGEALVEVERYRFTEIKVNPSFPADAFDPANPAYGF